jgi:hypothetical protein
VEFRLRIPQPDLRVREQVHQTGLALINLFGIDMYSMIDLELRTSVSEDWLTDYRKTELKYANYNFLDPGNLLKEIIRVSTTPLRQPLRSRIPVKDNIPFYSRLEVILDDRNDWVHHNIAFDRETLKTLIFNLYPICKRLSLPLVNECDYLLSLMEVVQPGVLQSETSHAETLADEGQNEVVMTLRQIIPENEEAIGEIVEDELLIYSYTLHRSGEIRDRQTNDLLSDVKPEVAKRLGALLIARKPNGGRLRVTPDGKVVAYFEDHWGYLATVRPDDWFPNHIWQ